MYGEGLITVDLAMIEGKDYAITGADIVVSGLAAVPELSVDRIKIADLPVIDHNVQPEWRNNIVTVSDDRFEIDPIDGGLYRKAGAVFDYESAPQVTITITATDGSLTYSEQLTLDIANVNEAPQGSVVLTGDAIENTSLPTKSLPRRSTPACPGTNLPMS